MSCLERDWQERYRRKLAVADTAVRCVQRGQAVEVRRSLFRFIERVLDVDTFDPKEVDALLE